MPSLIIHLTDVWVLYRMCAEIRFFSRLDVLYGYVWLLDIVRCHRWSDILRSRRYLYSYFNLNNRDQNDLLGLSPSIHSIDQIKVVDRFRGTNFSNSECGTYFQPNSRNTSRRSNGRLGLVWSWPGKGRLRNISPVGFFSQSRSISTIKMIQGRWIHLWFWSGIQIPWRKQYAPYSTRTSAVHGGILFTIRQTPFHRLVGTELLLPLRQFREYTWSTSGRINVLQCFRSSAWEREGWTQSAAAECRRKGMLFLLFVIIWTVTILHQLPEYFL